MPRPVHHVACAAAMAALAPLIAFVAFAQPTAPSTPASPDASTPEAAADAAATPTPTTPAAIPSAPSASAPRPPPTPPVVPPAASSLAPNLPQPAPPNSPALTIVTGVIALGAAGGGIFFGLRALREKQDFINNPTTDRADDAERSALLSDACFGLALALGVTVVVILLTGNETDQRATARAWVPSFQF